MRCYVCGIDVDPEHPDELKRRMWPYKTHSGEHKKICDRCNEQITESAINTRYKQKGRARMMAHNKARKLMGAY